MCKNCMPSPVVSCRPHQLWLVEDCKDSAIGFAARTDSSWHCTCEQFGMNKHISIWTLVRFVRQVLHEAGCEHVRQHFTWSQQQCDVQFASPTFLLRVTCMDPKNVCRVVVHLQPLGQHRGREAMSFTWHSTDLVQDLYSNICDTINPLLYGETYDC